MRRRSLLAFGLSATLLAAFLIALGPAALVGRLAGVDLPVFALGLGAMVATLACWSEGLRPLLAEAGGPASAWRVFVAYTAAMLGRQLLPMGAVGGPALTAYAVDREASLPYNETLAVVTVAEFLSVVASLVLAAVGAPLLLFAAPAVPQAWVYVLALATFTTAFLALAVAFWYRRRSVERLVVGSTRLLQRTVGALSSRLAAVLTPDRAGEGLDRFYRTVDTLAANRRTVLVSYGWHQAGWLCSALPLYTSALALGVEFPLALAFFLVPASHLVAVLPLPGGLGGVEFVLAAVLVALVGVDLATAGAVTLLYRLCSFWFLVAFGVLGSVYAAVPAGDFTAD